MLITNEVYTNVSSRYKKYYKELGYNIPERIYNYQSCTPRDTKIKVKVNDLPKYSNQEVQCLCDYCLEEGRETIVLIPYSEYTYNMDNSYSHKTACKKCLGKKQLEEAKYRNKFGLLKEGDKYYYYFKENRLIKLKEIINENKVITKEVKEKYRKYFNVIKRYSEKIEDLLIELNYNPNDIIKKPKHERISIEKVTELIQQYIDENKTFPREPELYKMGISAGTIAFYGGLHKLRNLVSYSNPKDLIDDTGYKNRSMGEYIISRWLILNTEMHYDRDVIISPHSEIDGKYNCDWVFYPEGEKPIYCEFWGGLNDNWTDYKETYKKKMEIYNKYNLNLISIYPHQIFRKSIDNIQEELYKIFYPYMKIKYKTINKNELINYSFLSNYDLLNQVMIYSETKDTLPKVNILYENKQEPLYREILFRFGRYSNFAKEMKVNLITKLDYYDDKTLKECFVLMIDNYNKILSRDEIKKVDIECLKGLDYFFKTHEGRIYYKLKYFTYFLENNIIEIPSIEIKWLESISSGKKSGAGRPTPVQQEEAKRLLDLINQKELLKTKYIKLHKIKIPL